MRALRCLWLLTIVLALPTVAASKAEPDKSDKESVADKTGLDSSFRSAGGIIDASHQQRPQLISAFVGIPAAYWGYGGFPFSLGGRFFQPILHDGAIPEVNDFIGIELGADFIGVGSRVFGALLAIPVEALWGFQLTSKFSVYAKLGIAVEIHFGSWCWGGVCTGAGSVGVGAIANVGLWYKVSDSVWLRAEVGYPGLKLGLGFPLL